MNAAIETLREQLARYDVWHEELNDEIGALESRIKALEQQRTELLTKVESVNEAIWTLQNATQ